jgi:hypothetical protein
MAGVRVLLADLPTGLVAEVVDGVVLLDADAAGWGWHADPASPVPTGRMDLLSVVLHELGHVLGHEHDEGGAVMAGELVPGAPGAVGGRGRWASPPGRSTQTAAASVVVPAVAGAVAGVARPVVPGRAAVTVAVPRPAAAPAAPSRLTGPAVRVPWRVMPHHGGVAGGDAGGQPVRMDCRQNPRVLDEGRPPGVTVPDFGGTGVVGGRPGGDQALGTRRPVTNRRLRARHSARWAHHITGAARQETVGAERKSRLIPPSSGEQW